MKKKMGNCSFCAYFENVKRESGSGYCHKSPPIIVQNFVKEHPEGGIEYSSVSIASMFPITFEDEFCGDFLSAEDVEWPK